MKACKTVLITGAHVNMGLAVAEKFLKEGWVVFITGRPGSGAQEKAEELSKIYDGKAESGGKLREIFKSLVTNPLIIGVFSGILAVAIRYLIPVENGTPVFTIQNQMPFIYTAVKNLSSVASPVMLICLGASLEFNFTKNLLAKISAGVVMRLIVVPVLAIGGAILLRSYLDLTAVEVPMLVAFFASPVAVSSANLVRELGGDDQYAGQLVVWSSVFSMVTLFGIIAILRAGAFL